MGSSSESAAAAAAETTGAAAILGTLVGITKQSSIPAELSLCKELWLEVNPERRTCVMNWRKGDDDETCKVQGHRYSIHSTGLGQLMSPLISNRVTHARPCEHEKKQSSSASKAHRMHAGP